MTWWATQGDELLGPYDTEAEAERAADDWSGCFIVYETDGDLVTELKTVRAE